MPPTNSTTSPSEPSHETLPDTLPDAIAQELNALQQTLGAAMTQMDSMAAALQEVIVLFKAGALEGEQGEQWLAQVRDRVLPFVAETQDALRDIADDIEDARSTPADNTSNNAPPGL